MRGPVCPKQRAVPGSVDFAFLENGDVRKVEPARLKINLPCVGLGSDQPAANNGHFHDIDIGQLRTLAVHAVVVGIAHKEIPAGVT